MRSIPEVIEETLRWETSVTMVSRVAARDTEVAGCPIAAGAPVGVLTASANHDETRWDDPSEWKLGRPVQHHLAFGTGPHQCLGMHLARLELRVGLEHDPRSAPQPAARPRRGGRGRDRGLRVPGPPGAARLLRPRLTSGSVARRHRGLQPRRSRPMGRHGEDLPDRRAALGAHALRARPHAGRPRTSPARSSRGRRRARHGPRRIRRP